MGLAAKSAQRDNPKRKELVRWTQQEDWLEQGVMVGGCPCSCTVRCLLDQLHSVLHCHRAIPGTRECPRTSSQCPMGEVAQHPGEGSRGVHSRLGSHHQPSLALCPGLFSSKETQRHSWKPGTGEIQQSYNSDVSGGAESSGRTLLVVAGTGALCPVIKWDSATVAQAQLCWGLSTHKHPGGKGCAPRLC